MIPRAPLFFWFLVSFFARLGEVRTEGTWPVPLRHPWAFFELWWRPWLFYGEGDAVWAHTIGGN